MADPAKPAAGTEKPETPEEKIPTVQQTAKDYLIPISAHALGQWKDDPKGFVDYAKQTAAGMFPTLAPQIQAGHTTSTLVDPYVQVAKQVLGPTAEPDWTDPKWTKALDGGFDPITKRPAPMSLNQWITNLHADPSHGFDQSPQAHDAVNGLIDHLSKSFNSPQGAPPTQPQGAVSG